MGAVVAGIMLAGQPLVHAQNSPSFADVRAGGGISDFTGAAASNLTKLGAEWEVRTGLNLGMPFKLEGGYVGSTHPINNVLSPFAPGGPSIRSNGLEVLANYEFASRFRAKPFVFGGFGWDHWNLSGGAQNNPMAIKGSDDTLAFPFGAGVRVPVATHWDLDGRFTYRGQLLDDMLQTNSAGQPNAGAKSLTTWATTARVGYVF
jgi:hypothetical protein